MRPTIPPDWDDDWLPVVQARLDRIEDLEQDWDSYNADPIDPKAISTARTLVTFMSILKELQPKLSPQIVPTTDSGLSIVWLEQGYDIELDIEKDGEISGWISRPDKTDEEF